VSAKSSELDQWLFRLVYRVGVVASTVATAVAAVIWSAAYTSANQYDQSPTCFFGACSFSDITEETAAVIDTGSSTGSKSSSYWVDLRGLTPEPKQVTLVYGTGVWPLLHPGDEVTVTLWRGLITSVRNDKASSQAWDNPDFTALNEYYSLLFSATLALALIIGPAVDRSKRARGTGWFFSAWVAVAGIGYFACLDATGRLSFFLLPVSFAVAGLVMYPIAVVMGSRRLRKRAIADARPTRVP
jgi:hypothetical protein